MGAVEGSIHVRNRTSRNEVGGEHREEALEIKKNKEKLDQQALLVSKAAMSTKTHLPRGGELVETQDGRHGSEDAAEDEGDDHEDDEAPPREFGVASV